MVRGLQGRMYNFVGHSSDFNYTMLKHNFDRAIHLRKVYMIRSSNCPHGKEDGNIRHLKGIQVRLATLPGGRECGHRVLALMCREF